jgi:hypothetical protein
MKIMKKEKVKQTITKICNEINAPIPVIMAIAGIESNFNPSAKSKSGTFVGIFQLSNGWGGCNGDDRLDLIKSIKCLWNGSKNAHWRDKERWKQISNSWDDFYYYGIHQMGFAGFADIYKNKNKLLSEISETRRKNILANKPKNANWSRVSDWWTYFEKRFYSIYNEHISTSFFDGETTENIVIIGGVVIVGITVYLIYRKNKKRK